MTASGRAAASMARASTSAQSSSNTKDAMCLKCGGSQLGNLESGKQIVHLNCPFKQMHGPVKVLQHSGYSSRNVIQNNRRC